MRVYVVVLHIVQSLSIHGSAEAENAKSVVTYLTDYRILVSSATQHLA
jgi:hypothetical protein